MKGYVSFAYVDNSSFWVLFMEVDLVTVFVFQGSCWCWFGLNQWNMTQPLPTVVAGSSRVCLWLAKDSVYCTSLDLGSQLVLECLCFIWITIYAWLQTIGYKWSWMHTILLLFWHSTVGCKYEVLFPFWRLMCEIGKCTQFYQSIKNIVPQEVIVIIDLLSKSV